MRRSSRRSWVSTMESPWTSRHLSSCPGPGCGGRGTLRPSSCPHPSWSPGGLASHPLEQGSPQAPGWQQSSDPSCLPAAWLSARVALWRGWGPAAFQGHWGSSSFGVFVFESCSFPLAQAQLLWAVGRTDRKGRGPSCGACCAGLPRPRPRPHRPSASNLPPASAGLGLRSFSPSARCLGAGTWPIGKGLREAASSHTWL